MAIPSGYGTEVLKRAYITWSSSSSNINLLEVPTKSYLYNSKYCFE